VGVQCVTGQRLNCSEGLWRDSRLKREDSAAYQRCRKSSVVHDASVKNDGAFAPAASSLTNEWLWRIVLSFSNRIFPLTIFGS
jgi:hypothetical protein